MLREFKAFVIRGNLLELAVALVLGVALGEVVTSLVNDVIMPHIGLVLGGVDFSNLFVNISKTSYPASLRRKLRAHHAQLRCIRLTCLILLLWRLSSSCWCGQSIE